MALSHEETTERLLSSTHSGGGGGGVNAAEAAFTGVAACPLPATAAGMVERQLFDALCGFSTGDRTLFDMDEGGGKAKKNARLPVGAVGDATWLVTCVGS